MEDLIRKKLAKVLGPDMAVNGQVALEHIFEGIAKTSPHVLTATREGRDRVIMSADFAELITLWKWGYELKAQDNRCLAMCCKLLKCGIR